jgi:hypothetical protein
MGWASCEGCMSFDARSRHRQGSLWVLSLCSALPEPSPRKTHRRRQQLDWGRGGAYRLLPSPPATLALQALGRRRRDRSRGPRRSPTPPCPLLSTGAPWSRRATQAAPCRPRQPWPSRCPRVAVRLVSNSANTASMSRKHLRTPRLSRDRATPVRPLPDGAIVVQLGD